MKKILRQKGIFVKKKKFHVTRAVGVGGYGTLSPNDTLGREGV